MKPRNLLVALIATAAFAPTVAHAASIGLNFNNGGVFANLTLTDAEEATMPADYFATDGYTNSSALGFGGNDFGMGPLGSSGITVTYTSSNTFVGGDEVSAAQQLHRGYLDDGDTAGTGDANFNPFQAAGDGVGVAGRITGLSAYIAANNAPFYVIRAYFTTDTGGATFQDITILDGSQVTATDGSDLFTADVLGTISGTVLGNGSYPDAGAGGGTRGFADSGLLTADNIVFYIPDKDGLTRGTLAGIRISTEMPAPAALPAGLGLIFITAMRRRNPRRRAA